MVRNRLASPLVIGLWHQQTSSPAYQLADCVAAEIQPSSPQPKTVRVPLAPSATVGVPMGATMEQASDGRLLHKPALIRWAVSYSPEG